MTDEYTLVLPGGPGNNTPSDAATTRASGVRGGAGGKWKGTTDVGGETQENIDAGGGEVVDVRTGPYSSVNSDWVVTETQSQFDLSNWPQGYGTDSSMYSDPGTVDDPSDARAEVLVVGVEFDDLHTGGTVNYKLTSPNGADTSLTWNIPDPSQEGWDAYAWYHVVFWVGKFPYELNEPGTYTVDLSGDLVDHTVSVVVENPDPVRYTTQTHFDAVRLTTGDQTGVWAWDYTDKEWDIYVPGGPQDDFTCATAKELTQADGIYDTWRNNVIDAGLANDAPCISAPLDENDVSIFDCGEVTVGPGESASLSAQVTNNNDAVADVRVGWYANGTRLTGRSADVNPNSGREINGSMSWDALKDTVGVGEHDDFEARIESVTEP